MNIPPLLPADLDRDLEPTLQGMTLRDYFAAAILNGITLHPKGPEGDWEKVAAHAYALADAMLIERCLIEQAWDTGYNIAERSSALRHAAEDVCAICGNRSPQGERLSGPNEQGNYSHGQKICKASAIWARLVFEGQEGVGS